MKKLLMTSSFAALLGPSIAAADPTLMIGAGFSFGGNQGPQYGVTAKVLSDDQSEEFVLGAGVSYYFGSGEFGADLSAGYLFDNTAAMVGYDFMQQSIVASLGYAEVSEVEAASPTIAPTTTVVVTTVPPTTVAPPLTTGTNPPPTTFNPS